MVFASNRLKRGQPSRGRLALPISEIRRLIVQTDFVVDFGYGALLLCSFHSCILEQMCPSSKCLAGYASPDRAELRREYPELEDEDIRQALAYAAAALDDRVIDFPMSYALAA